MRLEGYEVKLTEKKIKELKSKYVLFRQQRIVVLMGKNLKHILIKL